MTAVDELFAVQDEDTAAEQIRHRLANLSEKAALEGARGTRGATESQLETTRLERLELDRRQKRAEADVDAVVARVDELNNRLYGSGITSPKEAREVQEEVDRLRPRQDELEERLLEVLEEIDPLEVQLGELSERAGTEDAAIGAAEAAVAVAEAALEAELAEVQERRESAAAAVPDDLLARYERLRGAFGSSTVAGFDGNDCTRCPYSMPAVERDRIKHLPDGTLADCSECGRLVVG